MQWQTLVLSLQYKEMDWLLKQRSDVTSKIHLKSLKKQPKNNLELQLNSEKHQFKLSSDDWEPRMWGWLTAKKLDQHDLWSR